MKPTAEQLNDYLDGKIKNPEMGKLLGKKTKAGTVMCVVKWMKIYYKKGQLKIK